MTKKDDLEKQAIDLAISNRWREAITVNKKILKLDKKNIPALLRLGLAYLQTNKFKQAKTCYQKVLKLQPGNLISLDNLEKIKVLEEKKIANLPKKQTLFDPNLFLEVPGKTILAQLINLGQKNILAQLTIGEKVNLKIRRRKIEIRTEKNQYVGSLPDDLSQRLIFFLKAKSIYSCFIKEVNLKKVIVFIREEKKGNLVSQFISFPHNLQRNINFLKQASSEEEIKKETEEEEKDEIETLAEKLDENKDYFPPVDLDETEEEE